MSAAKGVSMQDSALRTPGGNAYGRFSADGREFVVTDSRTPRPWSNVIANPRAGLVVSQTGSGFSWVGNSQLAVVTRWRQDLTEDCSGRFLYVRDEDSGAVWSLAPAPVFPAYERFACRHGIGYTIFETAFDGIEASWTLCVDDEAAAEPWRISLRNATARPRRLSVVAFLEWSCGTTPSPRREFTKLFLETRFDPERRAVLATSHMWDVPNARFGHWNTSFPYVAAFASTEPLAGATGDRTAFTGRQRDTSRPIALEQERWEPSFGRHGDAAAALKVAVPLAPGEARDLGFVLATGSTSVEALALTERFGTVAAMDEARERAARGWTERLASHRIETPEPGLTALVNDWARYQAISARLWGRCGYYQQSGAYGFRDQLQDSQVWLTIDAALCRNQIALHARHQFRDGSVTHWWHPLTEQGHVTAMTDDLLWLGFVIATYVRETGDLTILDDQAPFLDEGEAPLVEHVLRAFARVFQRTSPRGLPYIGAGDWNDGLSAVGLLERGESVWLGHFLAGLLADWAEILRRRGDESRAADFVARRVALVAALNAYAWDGAWYVRATTDGGEVIGSATGRCGRIYLNAQTWAILNDVAPPDRAAACLEAVKRHLVSDAGALLLAPAYDVPVPEIGYITRYAPGLRENGGVYTHAATWAIAAAAKAKDAPLVERLLHAIDPTGKDPERYWAEPYVLPGNVDGPDSPHHGRAGWTWYTGSAAWLHRVVAEWVLGLRPDWDGLRVDPCLPPSWPAACMVRPWRNATVELRVERGTEPGVTVNGAPLVGGVLPVPRPGERLRVRAVVAG